MEAKQVLSEFPGIVDDSRVWFGHYLLLCFGWAEFLGMAGSYICISSSNFYFPDVHFLHLLYIEEQIVQAGKSQFVSRQQKEKQ